MTVIVGFYCADGVVIAADSMITTGVGGINVGHHTGQKLSIINGSQIFALAGDQGQNARVKLMMESRQADLALANPLDFPLNVTANIVVQFNATGIGGSINAAPMMAFPHRNSAYCCVFEGALQPRLLDADHFFAASGSGKLSADPFLRFLVDIFCSRGRPNVREAIFLATWTVQHVIDVNPGGVA